MIERIARSAALAAVRPLARAQKPKLFLLGHPRSGSGLLDGFLAGHPDIWMARKELHYFGADLGYHDPPRSLENYLQHFRPIGPVRWVGESSTWTLISETAADELRAFCDPGARFLVLLREPTGWLHSLHSHLVFTGDEDIVDFSEALAAEPDRIAGRRIPPGSMPRVATHYRAHTRYAEQVQRFIDAFGEHAVKVVFLDDLRDDPSATADAIWEWLGLPTDFDGRDEVLAGSRRTRNSNRTVKVPAIRDWVNAPSNRRVLEGVDPAPWPGKGVLIRAARRLNIEYTQRAPMDSTLRAQLKRELAPERDALAALLGRPVPASWQ